MSSPFANRDILLYVLEFIPSRHDLLNIGLTNSSIFSLAHPQLIYRVIRCNLGNDAIWAHFIANPGLAARVREVEILRENARIVPGLLERVPLKVFSQNTTSEEDHPPRSQLEKSENLLIQALRLMVNLESFAWDRWVPVTNVGTISCEGKPFVEDVWTVLRDSTQCKKLFAVDLGHEYVIVDDAFPIFRSSIFTLRNLTHINLKIFYSPVDTNEGSENAIVLDGLRGPRVRTSHLKTFLLACPRLQALILTILDHGFYNGGGIPYADVTSIFQDADWPLIEHLDLWDLTVDPQVMLSFLLRHPSLRILKANISFMDIPLLPFSFANITRPVNSDTVFLPNISVLDLLPKVYQTMGHLITYPWSIRKIVSLTPCIYGAPEPRYDDPSDVASEGKPPLIKLTPDEVLHVFKLDEMPELRDVSIDSLTDWAQIGKLAELTPQLETLRVDEQLEDTSSHEAPYLLWLPYLSKWPLLKAAHGISILPESAYKYLDSGLRPSELPQEIVEAITTACPHLRYLDDGFKVLIEDGLVVWPRDVSYRAPERWW